MTTSLGERIKAKRNDLDLTMQQLAALTGTTNQNISHMESGRNKVTSDMLTKLARAFNCSIGELMGETQSGMPPNALYDIRKNVLKVPLEKAAKMLDVTPDHLADIESGRAEMTLDLIRKIGMVFRVSPNELIGYAPSMTPAERDRVNEARKSAPTGE